MLALVWYNSYMANSDKRHSTPLLRYQQQVLKSLARSPQDFWRLVSDQPAACGYALTSAFTAYLEGRYQLGQLSADDCTLIYLAYAWRVPRAVLARWYRVALRTIHYRLAAVKRRLADSLAR